LLKNTVFEMFWREKAVVCRNEDGWSKTHLKEATAEGLYFEQKWFAIAPGEMTSQLLLNDSTVVKV
jgi:hypothetical protein